MKTKGVKFYMNQNTLQQSMWKKLKTTIWSWNKNGSRNLYLVITIDIVGGKKK